MDFLLKQAENHFHAYWNSFVWHRRAERIGGPQYRRIWARWLDACSPVDLENWMEKALQEDKEFVLKTFGRQVPAAGAPVAANGEPQARPDGQGMAHGG